MSERKYDLVVYGATGFTGRLVAQYLKQQQPKIRWAIAGRSEAKLKAVSDSLGLAVDRVLADATDAASLARLAASTRVLLTTVGPYATHGEPLLRAAVEGGCDYVDITGEPQFVAASIDAFDQKAHAAGLRIVHCCGFDSIPHDLGVLFALQELGVDATTDEVSVRAYVRAGGTTFSGGTFHSAVNAMSDPDARRKLPLAMPEGRTFRNKPKGPHLDRERGGWVVPMPTIDPQIVLRSASLRPDYGRKFTYGHHLVVKHLTSLVGMGAGLAGMAALAQVGPGRRWLEKLRPSGSGPTESQLENGWFNVALVGEANGKRVVVEVAGGEPGYKETAKMLSESALALLLDRDRLPKAAGVLTTASAMGEVLIERLVAAGMRFSRIG